MNNTIKFIALIVVLGLLIYAVYYFGQSKPAVVEKEPVQQGRVASSSMSFFVTSVNLGRGGDLGGLAGADAYCQTLAQSAGVGNKTWHAYLSTVATRTATTTISKVNARDRIGTGPWYNFDGILIAANVANLHNENNITKQTALTEKGEIVPGRGDTVNTHDIMTGSTLGGFALATSTDTTCSNWTSSNTGSAYLGHSDRVGTNETAAMKSWNASHASRGCSLEGLKTTGGAGLFYCFATN